MEKIAICGLACSSCPAYIATQKDDDAERRSVAEKWSREFNTTFSPEDINCDGCVSDGRIFRYCSICEIRKCGKGKGVLNCGYCDDYGCEKLTKWFEMVPDAKNTLERVRTGRS